ncbi:nucleotidyltransferase domain-containing protein [Micromonospora sp. B9E7]|uniref:nucleotidyltransferase domain-containing protein n=1 Tax=Micromonospora sp. B9E7 TaxID=3153574 RepID=UPI00325EBA3B
MVVTAPERLALARKVAARLATRPGVTSVFITGSMAVGLGNQTSDVDVYVAGPEVEASREQIFAGPVRIDVHRLSKQALEATVWRVVGATLRSDDGADVVREQDVTIALRLHIGEIVVDGGATALQETLSKHELTLRQLLITRWLNLAHYGQEDLAGLVDVPEDGDSAVMIARLLLRTAGKALAAACGDLFPGEKWVWRQLDRSAPATFPHAHYRHLLRADPLATGQGAVSLTDLRRFAQTCLAATATFGWHGVPLAYQPRWRGGDGPLRRMPELSVRTYRDGVVITSPESRRVRLSHEAALIWALCDGVDESTVQRDVERLRAVHTAARRLEPERVAVLADELLAARLIHRGPA